MLEKLINSASHSYQQYRDRHILPSPDLPFEHGRDNKECNNRLAMFGGKVRILNSGSLELSKAKRTSPQRNNPSGDVQRGLSSPGEGTSSPSDGGLQQQFRQSFDLRDYVFPASNTVEDPARPLVVPLMSVPSSSTTPPHFGSSPSTMPTYTVPEYSHPQAGLSTCASASHHSSMTSASHAYGVSNLQLQDSSLLNPDNVPMDPAAWYAAVNGTYISDFTSCTPETPQYADSHAASNQQWMHLMRDTGMFEQSTPAGRAGHHHDGGDLQPESIPESINMIF